MLCTGTLKGRKLAYYGHIMRKQGNCLEKEIMQGTMTGARRRGRPRTAWIEHQVVDMAKEQNRTERTDTQPAQPTG